MLIIHARRKILSFFIVDLNEIPCFTMDFTGNSFWKNPRMAAQNSRLFAGLKIDTSLHIENHPRNLQKKYIFYTTCVILYVCVLRINFMFLCFLENPLEYTHVIQVILFCLCRICSHIDCIQSTVSYLIWSVSKI